MEQNEEKILESMRRIKIQETINIIKQELGDINAIEDYKEFEKTNKVKDVKYLGKINIDKEIEGKHVQTFEDIFVLIEQKEITKNGQKQIIEIEKYVTENLEQIAGNNKSDMYNFPMATEKYKDQKEMIEKQLQEMAGKKSLSLNDIENSRLESIAKALNIEPDKIKDIDEIDLKQEISSERVEDKKNGKEKEEKGQEKLSKKELKGLNIKEETRLNQNIKGETLEEKLGLKKNGITDGVKLARVTTESLNPYLEKSSTQRDSFVVIRQNGEAVVLGENILEPEYRLGINPTGTDTTIDNDGTVKQEGITSSYRIVNGNGREYLRIGYDEISGKEIKYGMYSPELNDYVNVELETQRTKIQANDVRQFMKDKGAGQREAEKIIKRDKEHGECGRKDVTNIDNDPNNDSHTHEEDIQDVEEQSKTINEDDFIPNTNTKWKEFASLCGYRGENRIEKAYEKWNNEKAKTQNANKENEEIIEEIQEEINSEYAPEMQRR